MTPDEYCQEKAAKSGSSFYYSFLFLPPEKKQAITALYAFCREVDDIVDEMKDRQIARRKLDWWQTQIDSLYAGAPEHPVAQALSPAIERFGLKKELLHEIILGMEMDLMQNRYPDYAALELYCYRVAGVVGELSASIFGISDGKTIEFAHQLGTALQLTNIVRDVGEDATRNRIYLPQDELQRFGVLETDLLQLKNSVNFDKLMAFQIERARACYEKALSTLPPQDREAQKVGLIMAAIYRAVLEKIAKNPGRVLSQRTSLAPINKLWIAWKTWVRK